MAENTKIEWTDHSWSPWLGCSRVHAGCEHCYAETMHAKRLKLVQWGPGGSRRMTSDANWKKPMAWNRRCEKSGLRERVFCSPSSDVFEDWQGPMLAANGVDWEQDQAVVNDPVDGVCVVNRAMSMNGVRRQLFTLIDATPYLDWLLLTKRPENVRRMWVDRRINVDCGPGMQFGDFVGYRENVWLGVSVSDQATADKMIPELLKCRDLCAGLFVSAEPLLGPVGLPLTPKCARPADCIVELDWIIAGGESGPNARPMHPDWARSLRDQCQAAGVPFFFKQWGEYLHEGQFNDYERRTLGIHVTTSRVAAGKQGEAFAKVGKKYAGAILDGREWRETPF